MRRGIIALMLAWGSITAAPAQVSVGIGVNLPGVSIGINFPAYPQLVRVPDYPVYYAPRLDSNFFFYDGMYWVYEDGQLVRQLLVQRPVVVVGPAFVPVFLLRVPVRYFRHPPTYFRGWRSMRRRAGVSTGAVTGSSATRMGPLEPGIGARAGAVAGLSAAVRRRSLSAGRGAAVVGERNYRYQPRDPEVRQHVQTGSGASWAGQRPGAA